MTAYEIENSGIYNASSFSVTLKNGNTVRFGRFDELEGIIFFRYSSEHNILQSSHYYNEKGLHNEHIVIKGEDIIAIKILSNKEEAKQYNEKMNGFSIIVLGIILFIGVIQAYQSCH